MQEQLVSFKTAKLAKEKGFNYLVLYGYNSLGICKDVVNTDFGSDFQYQYINLNDTVITDFDKNNEEDWEEWVIYSAPTQSLLQRWLREKCNIFITIECDCHGKYDYHGYDTDTSKKCFIKLEHQVDESGCFEIGAFPYRYDIYEEALEEGLYEVLKLIK